MWSPARQSGAVAVSVLVVAVLLGCTWLERPVDNPTASPAPSASEPTPVPTHVVDGPTPRITSTCSDLAPLDTVRATLTDDVTEVPASKHFRSPDMMATQQVGALSCMWANRASAAPFEDEDFDYAGAVLRVVPDGKASWDRYAATYEPVSDPSPYGSGAIGPYCFGAEHPGVHGCEFDALIGTNWVHLSLRGVAGSTSATNEVMVQHARQFTDPLVTRLGSERPPAPTWSAPSSPDLDCSLLLTDEQATALTGVPDLYVGHYWDGPRVGQYVHGLEATGADRCSLGLRNSDSTIGEITYLPGGGWAFRELAGSWLAAGDAADVDLAGARPGEESTIECARIDHHCRVDILTGEVWIQVSIHAWVPDQATYPDGVDMVHARSQVQEIAETVLANVHTLG